MAAKTFIITNRATQYLFDEMTDPELNKLKTNLIVDQFSDGEVAVKPDVSVRGGYVYLLAENYANIMELMFTLDCLKRSSVFDITLILPIYKTARQDKRKNTRGSAGAKVMANMLSLYEGTLKRIVTFDIHADQIRNFFDFPCENIEGQTIFLQDPDIQAIIKAGNLVITPPDSGGRDRVIPIANHFQIPMVQLDKHREKANEVDSMILVGDVKDKNVMIWDDMYDTMGTAVSAVRCLKENGALDVYYVATHPILSGKAHHRIVHELDVKKMFMSNTMKPITGWSGSSKVRVVSCVPMIEKVITTIINDGSITELNELK